MNRRQLFPTPRVFPTPRPSLCLWLGALTAAAGCGGEERIDLSYLDSPAPVRSTDSGVELPPEADDTPVEVDGGTYPTHCFDGFRNGEESHLDCGGPCPSCVAGNGCVRAGDCASGVCDRGYCLQPVCHDAVKNGDETDVDCGGSCPGCEGGESCAVPEDCASTVCHEGACADTTCTDEMQNNDETDVDCGGSCPGCDSGAACEDNGDCASLTCDEGACTQATCDDYVRNQGEGDVDCGGPCEPCPDLARCNVDADCESALCQEGACSLPSCFDEVQNQDETGVDCGGTCDPCEDGITCEEASDCTSGVCDGTCQAASCDDGVQNGDETDVDCGGPTECARCEDFRVCADASDCETGMCTDGRCGDIACDPIGTDSFGYFGCSRVLEPAELPCPDISTTGTSLSLSDNDYTYVPIGFEFGFYGATHTHVAVQSNGALVFEDDYLTFSNQCLPDQSNLIAVFWDDLAPHRSGSTVRHETVGMAPNRMFVAQWETEVYFSSSNRGHFTAVLHEGTNDIQVCYESTAFGHSTRDTGGSATVGIQGSSSEYLQFSCDTATVVDGLLVDYFHP